MLGGLDKGNMQKILGIELVSTRIKSVLALFAYLGEQNLDGFLDGIFKNVEKTTISASESEIKSFSVFMTKYKKILSVERLVSEVL